MYHACKEALQVIGEMLRMYHACKEALQVIGEISAATMSGGAGASSFLSTARDPAYANHSYNSSPAPSPGRAPPQVPGRKSTATTSRETWWTSSYASKTLDI